MEALQTLGTALGLTALAGINLYLTVFMTGLAIQFHWLTNYPPGLEVLADPVVLIVAGVFTVVEAIADKCPYVDNAWDAIHTVIRPAGGMLLALGAVGDVAPAAQVVAALVGGSVAFTSHSLKAGTRLLVNTSPEPVSNIVLSTVEDGFVILGSWFAFHHPVVSLVVVIVFLVAFWYSAPKFYRMAKAHFVGVMHRMLARRRGESGAQDELPRQLPAFAHEPWLMVQREDESVAWAVPCYSGRMNVIGRHVHGCLVATTDQRLFFMGRKNFRARVYQLDVGRSEVLQDPGAVFHRLTIRTTGGDTVGLKFTRKYVGYVPVILRWLERSDQAGTGEKGLTGGKEEAELVKRDK
jgi:hypothetical protein